MPAVGSRPKTVDVRSDLQASSCSTWPLNFAVSTSRSIDRSTILHAVGRRAGSVSYAEESSSAGHEWRRQGLFREGLREVVTEFERQVRSVCFRAAMQFMSKPQPSATVTWRRELSSSNREVDKFPGRADSLLRHIEITGDFDFKDHNYRNHFLVCEIDSRVAARAYRVNSQNCSSLPWWCQHM